MAMTPQQCRAARALLEIKQTDLASASGVSLRTIASFERGESQLIKANLRAVQSALEAAGVHFIEPNGGGPGIRLKKKRGV
jgi:transcriptional regulator with XRE-family HTH domain